MSTEIEYDEARRQRDVLWAALLEIRELSARRLDGDVYKLAAEAMDMAGLPLTAATVSEPDQRPAVELEARAEAIRRFPAPGDSYTLEDVRSVNECRAAFVAGYLAGHAIRTCG